VRTNAPGLGSSHPYTLRCLPDLPMVTPIRHDELDVIFAADLTTETAPARLAAAGDVFTVFTAEAQSIGPQRFDALPKTPKSAIETLGPVFDTCRSPKSSKSPRRS
jgi:DNA primase